MSGNLHDELARIVSGYWYTQTIYVAAKLGLAEILKDGPKSAQELADATGTNARALYRLLLDGQLIARQHPSRHRTGNARW